MKNWFRSTCVKPLSNNGNYFHPHSSNKKKKINNWEESQYLQWLISVKVLKAFCVLYQERERERERPCKFWHHKEKDFIFLERAFTLANLPTTIAQRKTDRDTHTPKEKDTHTLRTERETHTHTKWQTEGDTSRREYSCISTFKTCFRTQNFKKEENSSN